VYTHTHTHIIYVKRYEAAGGLAELVAAAAGGLAELVAAANSCSISLDVLLIEKRARERGREDRLLLLICRDSTPAATCRRRRRRNAFFFVVCGTAARC